MILKNYIQFINEISDETKRSVSGMDRFGIDHGVMFHVIYYLKDKKFYYELFNSNESMIEGLKKYGIEYDDTLDQKKDSITYTHMSLEKDMILEKYLEGGNKSRKTYDKMPNDGNLYVIQEYDYDQGIIKVIFTMDIETVDIWKVHIEDTKFIKVIVDGPFNIYDSAFNEA